MLRDEAEDLLFPLRQLGEGVDRRTGPGPLTYLPILIVANDPQYMGEHRAPIKVDPSTAQVFKLPAMVNPGVYPKPMPFGGMGKPV